VDPLLWHVEHLAQIDSTNSWLKDRALDGADEGLVVYAEYQSRGRGRLDRQWEAPAGSSLLCSILLRRQARGERLQLVVAAVALSVRGALARLVQLEPGLKWPNDLVVGDAKLAGLLAEFVATPGGPAVVVGLGVNLSASPPHVRATNVLEASGVALESRALLDASLEELTRRLDLLESETGRVQVAREYAGALATLGQRVRVQQREREYVGEAVRVDDLGQLVVNVEGVEWTFSAGDVVHVRTETGEVA